MNAVVPWLLAAVLAAVTPAPSPSPAERPLREIGRVRSSSYCTSFTNHFNAAVIPLLKNDFAIGLLDRSLDELERHFGEMGGEVRVFDDRLRIADAVRRMQEAIPRAQSEIDLLRDGSRLGPDPERIGRVRDLAAEMQKALDRQKQIAHDVGNIVHVLIEMSANDPKDDVFYNVKRATGPDTATVAAPALTGAQPVASSAPMGTTVKELLRWSAQHDRIDEAEAKAATGADQIITSTCGPTQETPRHRGAVRAPMQEKGARLPGEARVRWVDAISRMSSDNLDGPAAVRIVRLGGEYDVTRQSALAKELAVGDGAELVNLDISEVIYLDSIALGMLRAFQERVRDAKGTFRIVAQREHIKKIVQIVGLDKTADIFHSVQEALDAKPAAP